MSLHSRIRYRQQCPFIQGSGIGSNVLYSRVSYWITKGSGLLSAGSILGHTKILHQSLLGIQTAATSGRRFAWKMAADRGHFMFQLQCIHFKSQLTSQTHQYNLATDMDSTGWNVLCATGWTPQAKKSAVTWVEVNDVKNLSHKWDSCASQQKVLQKKANNNQINNTGWYI